jgi:hypothetical protein
MQEEQRGRTEPSLASPSTWLTVSEVGTLTPEVLFINDLVRLLRTSRSTIERRRRSSTFPIPELPISVNTRPLTGAANSYFTSYLPVT